MVVGCIPVHVWLHGHGRDQARRTICTDLKPWKCRIVFAVSFTKQQLAELHAGTNCLSQCCAHPSFVCICFLGMVVINCIIVLPRSTILAVMVITAAVV